MQKRKGKINNKNNLLISKEFVHTNVKSKTQLLKTASNLKAFSTKIKTAQDEVLTPEIVKDMAMEIMEVAEVAAEVAAEIAEGVPAEEMGREERREEEPEQIEIAQEEKDKDKDKQTAGIEKGAQDKMEDEDDDKMKSLEAKLEKMERKAKLAELAPKYAKLFPQSMHEAKMNEILNSKLPLNQIGVKIQEASDIITNKTMVKVASMSDSIFDVTDGNSEEVNIAQYL